MEIKADIGKDTHNLLLKVVRSRNESIDIITAEALNIGARILYSNLKNEEKVETDVNEILEKILVKCTQNVELSSEILSMNFDKEKSIFGSYDVETSVRCSDKIAKRAVRMSESL